ncbi:hypothetical protein [Ralstonia solanacearum]|uniref:hypothetical protein n=1 Tax=Ralstonia solanacearum TaxID=305 RepID=UPI001E309B90|nr:hypothetical protein [Ralstonia solanacearum]
MNSNFKRNRRLVSIAALSLLASGCARYARYQEQQKVFEERNRRDLELMHRLKTVTVLAPKTDRDINVAVIKPLIPMKEHVEELKRAKPNYVKALHAAMTNSTITAELSDAVARRLERMGYTVNQVFSDEQTRDRQAIGEANFGTDLVYAISAPQLSVVINVQSVGLDHYFFSLRTGSAIVHAKNFLSLDKHSVLAASPISGYEYYLLARQWDDPEAVRSLLKVYIDDAVDLLFWPIEPD